MITTWSKGSKLTFALRLKEHTWNNKTQNNAFVQWRMAWERRLRNWFNSSKQCRLALYRMNESIWFSERISTTSKTPVMQTTVYLSALNSDRRVAGASGFLFIDLFVLLFPSFSEGTDFESINPFQVSPPVIELMWKEQPRTGESNSDSHKIASVFLCLLGRENAASAGKASRRTQPAHARPDSGSAPGLSWTPCSPCHLLSGSFLGHLQV